MVSASSRWNSRFKHGSAIVHSVFAYFTLSLSGSPSIHDPGKMLVLPNQLLYWVLSTSDQYCNSFQPIVCHPRTQIRIILFHDERRDIPNLEFSPSHVSIGFSQIAFPIIVLPKDDHTDFAQEERLGLPYWTMILAICVVVDESKCLDTPILEFSIILEHIPFLSGYKLTLRSAARAGGGETGDEGSKARRAFQDRKGHEGASQTLKPPLKPPPPSSL